jgi:hypothetical protein
MLFIPKLFPNLRDGIGPKLIIFIEVFVKKLNGSYLNID